MCGMGTEEMLRAAGIGRGDEVVVPAFGRADVAGAVVAAGAQPVFADIDPHTYCLDAEAVAAATGPRTAAMVVVHRFGRPAPMWRLRAHGERHRLLVLEERDAVGQPAEVTERRKAADHLDQRLRGVATPERDREHTYTQYVVRVPGNGRPDRDAFARALKARGVACSVPVKTPLHRTADHWRDIRLPATERAADDTLALPLVPARERRGLHRLVSACNALGGLLQPA
ncbi:DegT/DnrJ/EryC1/StrS aminotransferase [Streptomyces sp. SID8455]|nr:DegT/DnrJ/EryC1/StrS family aminotransferase [Streptomyces sp. BRB081]MBL3804076.1 DegT/DnrJ/EryC1/StrS family aminotransferase [Streptomyces sp. BRB081]NEE58679.1 DegT/DnrJ/EryC1/StrS aminotransferase [Streptomyces sp. SID8455]